MFDAEKERAPQLDAEDGLASAGAIVSSASAGVIVSSASAGAIVSSASAGAIVKAAPQLVLYGASAGTW